MSCLLTLLLFLGVVNCGENNTIDYKDPIVFIPNDSVDSAMTFAVLGNSISTYSGTLPDGYPNYYTSSKLLKDEMWWARLSQKTGYRMIANSSWSGSTVSCHQKVSNADSISFFYSDNRINSLSRNGNPDMIIVLGGTNDWNNNAKLGNVENLYDVTTFYGAYSLMVEKIKCLYPNTSLVLCGILPRIQGTDSENKAGWTIRQGNEKIREISQSFNAIYVDLDYCGIKDNFTRYTFDGLHPNAAGMELVADEIIRKLRANN